MTTNWLASLQSFFGPVSFVFSIVSTQITESNQLVGSKSFCKTCVESDTVGFVSARNQKKYTKVSGIPISPPLLPRQSLPFAVLNHFFCQPRLQATLQPIQISERFDHISRTPLAPFWSQEFLRIFFWKKRQPFSGVKGTSKYPELNLEYPKLIFHQLQTATSFSLVNS